MNKAIIVFAVLFALASAASKSSSSSQSSSSSLSSSDDGLIRKSHAYIFPDYASESPYPMIGVGLKWNITVSGQTKWLHFPGKVIEGADYVGMFEISAHATRF
jgi:hypothetical protein